MLKPVQVSGFVYRKYIKRTLNMFNYSTDILENLNREGFSKTREEEYQDVKKLNNDLKETTANMVQESGYYSRMDYYNSLSEDE